MHTTRLPKLKSRRNRDQLEKRRERIKSRAFERKITEGVRQKKGSILWTWQETTKQLLRRGPGSTGQRGW